VPLRSTPDDVAAKGDQLGPLQLGGTGEVELLGPRRLLLCHHDNWMPPFTQDTDSEPIRSGLSATAPSTELIELDYLDPYPVLK
jgi:hypothetical protein